MSSRSLDSWPAAVPFNAVSGAAPLGLEKRWRSAQTVKSRLSSRERRALILFGEPSGTRTRDPVIKSHMLYQPELTAHRRNLNRQSLQGIQRIGSARQVTAIASPYH